MNNTLALVNKSRTIWCHSTTGKKVIRRNINNRRPKLTPSITMTKAFESRTLPWITQTKNSLQLCKLGNYKLLNQTLWTIIAVINITSLVSVPSLQWPRLMLFPTAPITQSETCFLSKIKWLRSRLLWSSTPWGKAMRLQLELARLTISCSNRATRTCLRTEI